MADSFHDALIETVELKDRLLDAGFELVGVTDAAPPQSWPQFSQWVDQGKHGTMGYLARSLSLRQDLNSVLPGVRSVIMVGLNYAPPRDEVEGDPKIARYARGRDYHRVIPRLLKPVARWIEETYSAQTRIAVDSAPNLERDLANRAGLGWFGKNTMLINSERGSWFLLGCLLTTAEFRPDEPAIGGCGTCRKCIDACPTGAIVHDNERWQVDARQCISYVTIEHRGELPEGTDTSGWLFGCDICQEVCPFNTVRTSQPLRARTTEVPEMLERREWPAASEMDTLSPDSWDLLTRGSPVRRAGYEGLKRNARLVRKD